MAHAAVPIIIDVYSEHVTAKRQQLLPIFTIADASIIIAIAQISGRRKDHHSASIFPGCLAQIWGLIIDQKLVKCCSLMEFE